MRTPEEYTNNLKKKYISKEMLEACLYSANKRAKNYRDISRKIRRSCQEDNKYWQMKHADTKKEEFYSLKEKMLGALTPICIHREIYGYERIRIYSYQDEYWEIPDDEVVWRNKYYDPFDDESDGYGYIHFKDINDYNRPKSRYYLFYDLGGAHTFHTPINEEDLELHNNLEIISISELKTFGKKTNSLVSPKLIKKVADLIDRGFYEMEA